MAALAEVYFGLPVDVVTPVPIEGLELPTRERAGYSQYDALGLLAAVRPVLPDHAYAMTVLLNHDVFTTPEQSYGFGYATHTDRLAVMSFARLEPNRTVVPRGVDAHQVVRTRGYKVLVHELGHTFGLPHCDHHACVMNGMADAREVDETPMHLCPVCLRKLMHVVGFDPVDRYRSLQALYSEHRLEAEAGWVRARLLEIERVSRRDP